MANGWLHEQGHFWKTAGTNAYHLQEIMLKNDKMCICVTVSGYELSERPS